MESNEYLLCVASYYMCNIELAKKLVKSAELNGNKKEIYRIVQLKEKELNHNADQFFSPIF